MLAPLNDFIPFTIFTSSLIGSWHCAGMCGAIACSASLQGKSHLYHFGRMISYVTLGALAGLFGQNLLASDFVMMQKISAFLMSAILLVIGLSFVGQWKLQSQYLGKIFFPILKRSQEQKFLLGLLTGLLPCGWLYTFVLAAAAMQSPLQGMFCMFLFWLGSVPALTFMSAGLGNLMQAQGLKLQRLLGGLLIFAGLYSVVTHLYSH